MAEPRFRNPDKIQELPHRTWIRKNMPWGDEGNVVEDLDLVLRRYGPRYGLDEHGNFNFAELKYGDAEMDTAKRYTFGLIDKLLRQADPMQERYKGFFILNYSDEDWDKADFKLNGIEITKDQFWAFLNGDFHTLPDLPGAFSNLKAVPENLSKEARAYLKSTGDILVFAQIGETK